MGYGELRHQLKDSRHTWLLEAIISSKPALAEVSMDRLLPQAFALVREASRRVLGLRPFDLQVIAAITLHQGKLAEMQTGKGKTLAAVLPAYLNALAGHGVHVLTFNFAASDSRPSSYAEHRLDESPLTREVENLVPCLQCRFELVAVGHDTLSLGHQL